MENRRYKPTTHRRPVSRDSETRSHYTSWHMIAGKTLGWASCYSGQNKAVHWRRRRSVCAGGPLSPGSRIRGLLQRKRRQTQRVYTSFVTPTCYFWYAEWQFEIRISICTNDISFIVYRLTSLGDTYICSACTRTTLCWHDLGHCNYRSNIAFFAVALSVYICNYR